MSEYEPVISDSTKEINEFDVEKQVENEKQLNNGKQSNNNCCLKDKKICRKLLCLLLSLTFIAFILYHCNVFDMQYNYDTQYNYEFLNSTRRNLRIGRVHHHQDTCSERLEKEKTSCCSEDLRCYGYNFNDHQIEKNLNLNYYSKLQYENEKHNYCRKFKKHKIIEMIFNFNYWKGNKNYINDIEDDYYYYTLNTINTIVNTTKCNEDSHLGCCQIKNTCENTRYNLAILNENNNCPSIKDLMHYDKIGYPKENTYYDEIFLGVITLIFIGFAINECIK